MASGEELKKKQKKTKKARTFDLVNLPSFIEVEETNLERLTYVLSLTKV